MRSYREILQEKELTSKEREKILSNKFGAKYDADKDGDLDLKYPLIDANHVRSAISYFWKANPSVKPGLAKKIKIAAKKYNVEIGKDTDVAKYLNEAESNIMSHIEKLEIAYNDCEDEEKCKEAMTHVMKAIEILQSESFEKDVDDEDMEEKCDSKTKKM